MKQKLKNELNKIVQGRCAFDYPLKSYTSMKMAGRAEVFIAPKNQDELSNILVFIRRHKVPYFILGGGANVCILSKVVRGVVLSLKEAPFGRITHQGSMISAGAGVSIARLLIYAARNNLSGLEALAGIPGSVGGSIFMNAGGGRGDKGRGKGGAFWISDALAWLMVMSDNGKIKKLSKDRIDFRYRSSGLKDIVILEAGFKLRKSPPGTTAAKTKRHLEEKRKVQDLDHPSSGCIFKNPKGTEKTSGQIIEECGLKGFAIGEAQVSPKHANFIINNGCAVARDVRRLIGYIKKTVFQKTGVRLEEEVKTI